MCYSALPDLNSLESYSNELSPEIRSAHCVELSIRFIAFVSWQFLANHLGKPIGSCSIHGPEATMVITYGNPLGSTIR